MPAKAESQHPVDTSSLGRLVARRPVAAFVIMAYAFGWPALLAGHYLGLPFLIASSLGVVIGLALPAFLTAAATGGEAGVRDLLGRCLRWRVGVRWYLVALLGLPAATLLVASAFPGLAPLGALGEKWPLFFTTFLPRVLVLFVLIQLFEEAGWTGLMQDRLQGWYGPLLASILVAPAFALFHLPLVLLEASQVTLALFQVAVQAVVSVFFRVVIMWLYNGAGRSVLVVALFHTAFNTVTGPEYATRFIRELISGPAALPIGLAVVAVAAGVIVILTKGNLAYEPDREASRPVEVEEMAARRGPR